MRNASSAMMQSRKVQKALLVAPGKMEKMRQSLFERREIFAAK